MPERFRLGPGADGLPSVGAGVAFRTGQGRFAIGVPWRLSFGRGGENVKVIRVLGLLAPLQGATHSCRSYRWFQALTRLPHIGYLLFVPPVLGLGIAPPVFNRTRTASRSSHRAPGGGATGSFAGADIGSEVDRTGSIRADEEPRSGPLFLQYRSAKGRCLAVPRMNKRPSEEAG